MQRSHTREYQLEKYAKYRAKFGSEEAYRAHRAELMRRSREKKQQEMGAAAYKAYHCQKTAEYKARKKAGIKVEKVLLTDEERKTRRIERRRRYVAANRDKVRADSKRLYKRRKATDPKGHFKKNRLYHCRHRAKKAGIPFNLTLDDIQTPDVCPVFGVPLDYTWSGTTASPNCPSIDKIVPELGYVAGNIITVSHRANSLKNNANLDEMRMLLKFYDNLGSACS